MDSSPSGQLLLVGVPGPELDAATAATIRRVQPGGFVLFTRNIVSPSQLRRLVDDLRDLSRVEPIVTIDQEGGRVSRLRVLGSEPPSASQLRARDDVGFVRQHGELMARLLRLFGFNLDLAPVLDLCLNGDETVDNSLRGRCYGVDTAQTVRLAGAFLEGLRAGGVLNCGKHFPGYTAARADAHHELPAIPRSRAELDELELVPFRHFIDRGELDSVMVAHAFYPFVGTDDTGRPAPASLSPAAVRDLLRGEFGFKGLSMTDDLDMGAIYHRYGLEDALRLALLAGNDLAMICHRVDALDTAAAHLAQLPASALDGALERVATLKRRLAPPTEFSEDHFRSVDAEVWNLRVQVLGPEEAARRSPEDGKRSPVEIY